MDFFKMNYRTIHIFPIHTNNKNQVKKVITYAFFFMIVIVFIGCQDQSVKNKKADIEQDSLDPLEKEYQIINATLAEIFPKTQLKGRSIMVNGRLFVADDHLINDFIVSGGNSTLHNISKKNADSQPINTLRINDFNGIEVLHISPLTNKELERHLGGINFSKIIFSEQDTKASFIYHFERLHDRLTKKLCAIDVELIDGKWEIINTLCLDNHDGILYN